MIKNDRQYRITKAAAGKFEHALHQLESGAVPAEPSVHPAIARAHRDAIRSQLEELQAELREYEDLRRGSIVHVLELESLRDVPRALVRARISSGLSQKELAKKLGLKEQQIQRYESTEYQHASLARLVEVAEALAEKNPDSVSGRKRET
jgi:ribosome-binding protein aMBF1 (putative translation factor)